VVLWFNPKSGIEPRYARFIILLCITPDDFTRQGDSAANQWANKRNRWPGSLVSPSLSRYFLLILSLISTLHLTSTVK
jgi:hypothetical protein